MNIQQLCSVVKNGNDYRVLVKERDLDQPLCWVEGHQYQFSTRLVQDKQATANDLLQWCGLGKCENRPLCV